MTISDSSSFNSIKYYTKKPIQFYLNV